MPGAVSKSADTEKLPGKHTGKGRLRDLFLSIAENK